MAANNNSAQGNGELSFAEAAAQPPAGDVNLDEMPVDQETTRESNSKKRRSEKKTKQDKPTDSDDSTPKPIDDPKSTSAPGTLSFADAAARPPSGDVDLEEMPTEHVIAENGKGHKRGKKQEQELESAPKHLTHGSVSFADAVKTEPPEEKKQPRHRKAGANGNTNGNATDIQKNTRGKSNGRDRPNGVRRQSSQSPPTIRWAPLRIPLRRRLQTLAVLLHSSILLISVPLFLFICAIPLSWPFLIPYFLHVLLANAPTNGHLAYRSEWWRSLGIWKLFAGYFPARLHKTHDLSPERKYIFGYHPHGIISHGAWAAFATNALGFAEKFPGITNSLLTLESNFNIPIYREYLLFAGLRSVSRTSIKNILSKGGKDGKGQGRAVTVVVGGARESLSAQPGTMRLILQDRVGFIKMAIRTGADIVPVLCFGETSLYDQLSGQEHPWVHKFQMFVLRVWKFTLPFLHGRGVFNYDYGMMPYRHPMNIVVGKPIPVQASENDIADPEEVARVHGLYCDELQKLWDQYKDEFAQDREEEMQFMKAVS